MHPIDIIIPFNAICEELAYCIESVKRYTDLKAHRIVLVNDTDSQDKAPAFFESLKESCIVLNTEKRAAFAERANIGLLFSDRDVVLLSPDTIVTENWLEKIIECASSEIAIGAVSPYTDCITGISVPGHMPLERYAKLVEWCSIRRYPEIPPGYRYTGCMLIKRTVMNAIGLLKEKLPDCESDVLAEFCHRMSECGFKHVLCDDVYIKSRDNGWGKEAKVNGNESMDLLAEQIRFFEKIDNGKKNLFYLLQSDFREDADDHTGGTQLHVKDLTMALKEEYNIVVAARNLEYLNVTVYLGQDSYLCQFYIGKVPAYPVFRDEMFARLYGALLDSFHVDLVHVHHVRNLSLEIFYQAAERKIPVFASIHDYFYVCPLLNLWRPNKKICTIDTVQDCRECLKTSKAIGENLDYISFWRQQSVNALRLAEVCIVPSNSTREIFSSFLPELSSKMVVIEHGISLSSVCQKHKKEKNTSEFHVAFLGSIGEMKGSHDIYELVKADTEGIKWYFFGQPGDLQIAELKGKRYKCTGKYERNQLETLFNENKIDLVCILSQCPETFSYTVSEAVALGTPVVVRDVGALGERVRNMKCGWVVSENAGSMDILKVINNLKKRPQEYHDVVRYIERMSCRDVNMMAADYSSLYRDYVLQEEQSIYSKKAETGFVFEGYLYCKGKSIQKNDHEREQVVRFREMERQLKDYQTSTAYCVAGKIRKIKFPFKERLGNSIKNIYRLVRYGRIY